MEVNEGLMNIGKAHEVLAGIAVVNHALFCQANPAIDARPEKGMAVRAETPLHGGGKPDAVPHGEPARLPDKPRGSSG